jgi:hypothetical protein
MHQHYPLCPKCPQDSSISAFETQRSSIPYLVSFLVSIIEDELICLASCSVTGYYIQYMRLMIVQLVEIIVIHAMHISMDERNLFS